MVNTSPKATTSWSITGAAGQDMVVCVIRQVLATS
jgi:hypothetical protein